MANQERRDIDRLILIKKRKFLELHQEAEKHLQAIERLHGELLDLGSEIALLMDRRDKKLIMS